MPNPQERLLLDALASDPADELLWQALADWREERGLPSGELLRLHLRVRAEWDNPERERWQARMGELLQAGAGFDLPRLTHAPGMEFALVPPGKFLMGSPPGEEGRSDNEGPQHPVEITRPFYLATHPVTVGQYRAFVEATGHDAGERWRSPGFEQDDRHPVVCVSWEDAGAFCAWLTKLKPGRLYRLPTEAEWEYGCRGGAPASWPFHFGPGLSPTQANFDGNYPYGGAAKGPYRERTTPVGSYSPNSWGLYDLHGNVWEWCQDWYAEDYYQSSPRQDPAGPPQGPSRLLRGGSWLNFGWYCRSAYRRRNSPGNRFRNCGFRAALVLSGE